MTARIVVTITAAAFATTLVMPMSPATATNASPPPSVPTSAQASATGKALEAKALAARKAEPTEAQRLAVAARTKDDALAISTSSIAAMNRTQVALKAAASGTLKASAVSQASVGAAVTPHYYGPYSNYANSPQHLPTALVTFSEPPHAEGWRVAAGSAVVDANGVVTGVTITDAGSGYTSAPTVTIAGVGSGAGATAVAVMTNGIGGLTLTQAGLGYNDPVTVSFVGGGGSGAAANAVIDTHGAIASLTLTSAGHGFTMRPAVRFSDPVGSASVPAVATASLTKLVASVTVTKGGTGYVTPGIRKFVDTLPVPGSVGADGTSAVTKNDLGQYLPVAIPDTTTYPGDDYYEIAVVQYREQLHKDLPAQGTLLRGYVQLSTTVIPGKHVALYNDLVDGTRVPVKLPNGDQAYGVDLPQYLGPIVNAEKNRPVRVLFRDLLPIGVDGDLFLPVDTTVMGSGAGPNGMSQPNMGIGADMQNPECGKTPKPTWCYTENRATIHLHGGLTPWISDGTPHQWITPAGQTTDYPQGVSVKNVPDMPDPGPGAQTFFYTNQQSARLLWFHDHTWGITRLNVYAGEVSGYIVSDSTEKALVASGTIPGADSTLPLIIQDKTFVPSKAELSVSDPTWDTAQWGGEGNLWVPHVYMPAQNAQDSTGVNQFGRWMYGPWFWPPTTDIQVGLIDNPYAGQCIAGTDWCEPSQWAKIPGVPNESMGMESFNDTPLVNGTAYPVLTVDPKSYRFRVLNGADDRFWNLSLYKAAGKNLTEVALNAADVAAGKTDPAVEPKVDETVSTPGPSWIQIGTEGGFLPTPAVVPASTIGYITDPTVFDFGNINKHSLLLGPAERADVIVDFSKFAGQTLILYNDAPAAAPARDPRYDYYTDHADLRSTGGAAPTPEGYGPNTRTVMQIRVAAKTPAPAFNMTKLNVAFQATELGGGGVFETSQHPILVGQSVYNQAYDTSFGTQSSDGLVHDGYVRMTENSLTFNTLTNANDANAGDIVTMNTTSVAMHDEMGAAYDKVYGRMSGSMGVESPAIQPGQAQNLTLYPYTQPATEVFDGDVLPPGDTAVQIPTPAEYGNNIQLWKITHNGVDTHPIHFHLADVQLINRVSWDGIIRNNDPNELGWKDTVRVNPLSDTIVAIRPLIPQSPFGIDVSKRSPNPAMPADASAIDAGLVSVLPDGNSWLNADGSALDNRVIDMGWEYVWHCHILSHEEMDMMRPIKVNVPVTPPDPSQVWFTAASGLTLAWSDPTPATSDGSINASWGDPKNEIGYSIQSAPVNPDGSAGTFTTVTTALANQTSFVIPDGGATPRFWRVKAYNAAGDTASVEQSSATPAGAPTGVSAAPALNGMALTWGTPAPAPALVAQAAGSAAGPAADEATDGYRIDMSANNGLTWTTLVNNTGSTNRSYAVTGLTARVPYVFRVAAWDGDTLGPWSLVTAPGLPEVAPARVTGVQVTPHDGRLGVTWRSPDNGGTPILSYAVQYSTTGRVWINGPTTDGGANSVSVDGLANGVPYYVRVMAHNAAGNGAYSSPTQPYTPFTTPSAPARVTASPGNHAATVAWGDTPDGGSVITAFVVRRSSDKGHTWSDVATVKAAARSARVTGLRPGRSYTFRVVARNAAGLGTPSGRTPVVKPFTTPAAPKNLVGRVSGARVTLTWTKGADGGSRIVGYRIESSTDSGRHWKTVVASTHSTRTTALVTGLARDSLATFRVRALNGAGAGTASNWSHRLEIG